MTDRTPASRPEISATLDRAGKGILVLFGLASVAGSFAVLYYLDFSLGAAPAVHKLLFAGGLVAAAVMFGALRLKPDTRVGVSVSLIILAAGVFGIDAYLSKPEQISPAYRHGKELGVTFDAREMKDVLFEQLAAGRRAHLMLLPADHYTMPLRLAGKPLLPFTNPPRTLGVLCNENGPYVFIDTDEVGFNNPPGLWDAKAPLDLALIGDSFTEGWCAPRGTRLADHIRRAFPRTVNLGRGGLGMHGELAILREYLSHLRPHTVVWVFFENDIWNFDSERNQPLLKRYLESPDFSQGLFAHRQEVNKLVEAYQDGITATLKQRRNLPFLGIRHFLNTWQLRNAEGRSRTYDDGYYREFSAAFAKVMTAAKTLTACSGANLAFVYLPDFIPSTDADKARRVGATKARVLATLDKLAIPALDVTGIVGAQLADPRDVHRLSSDHPASAEGNLARHYNVLGHRIVGTGIADWLSAQQKDFGPVARPDHCPTVAS